MVLHSFIWTTVMFVFQGKVAWDEKVWWEYDHVFLCSEFILAWVLMVSVATVVGTA